MFKYVVLPLVVIALLVAAWTLIAVIATVAVGLLLYYLAIEPARGPHRAQRAAAVPGLRRRSQRREELVPPAPLGHDRPRAGRLAPSLRFERVFSKMVRRLVLR